MADFGFLSVKDDLAVDNLISQAKDLYVLEQVAAINCSVFTDSSLPTNLETRFRRLKSLPVSRPDPVSPSKKLLSHSKSMAEKNRGKWNAPSADQKRDLSGIKRDSSAKYRPLDSSVEETRVFPGIKPGLGSVPQQYKISSNFEKTGPVPSKFSRDGKVLSQVHLGENPRISSSSIGLASQSSDLDRKSKQESKLSALWLRAMGCCLCRSPSKSSSSSSSLNSKETMDTIKRFQHTNSSKNPRL